MNNGNNDTFPNPAASDKGPAHSRFRSALLATSAFVAIVAVAAGVGHFGSRAPLAHYSGAAFAAEASQPVGFANLVAKVKPAVISVRVRLDGSGNITDELSGQQSPREKFANPFRRKDRHEVIIGEGSGFFISDDGYAVTNNHVVDHAKSVRVTTDDGTIYTAKVVGTDPKSDLALIKVDAHKSFPYVQFAQHSPRVGQWVVAVGNPFGLGGTVTAGIVSARGRDIGGSPYDDYLQIDAPINRGNSGGPAFNMSGRVIGVNTAIFSPSGGSVGIGFDIPADTAQRVISQLKDKGHVTRGWMGVEVQPVTPSIAESLGMKKAEGALVDEPRPDSPAAKAGIKAGDVITALDGASIKDARTLARKTALGKPGSTVKLTVLRDGQSKTVELKLVEMPQQQEANAEAPQQQETQPKASVEPQLGLNLAPAHDVAGSGDKGVVVLGVDPDGAAASNGVQSGDIILNVGGKAVDNPAQVGAAIDQSRSQGKHAVLMRVQTAQGTHFIAVPIKRG